MDTYGKLPKVVGTLDIFLPEVMYYLYLPIKLRGQEFITLPRQLRPVQELIATVKHNLFVDFYRDIEKEDYWTDCYIYLTVKKMFCSPSVTANRPGWHADGFGTQDLNYVWYDCLPTEFSDAPFNNISDNHLESIKQFENKANVWHSRVPPKTYQAGTVLRLDPFCVHRVAEAKEQLMRTFIKVSVSKDKYNLKDNSINHDLDYDWQTYDRALVRNSPNMAQRDSYTPPVDDHLV